MARLEYIKRRLDNWALWTVRNESGGLGFATQSVLANDVWCEGSYDGARVPVLELEAEETDLAVQSLKLTRSHLFHTLDCIYLKALGVKATALEMGRAESTIKAQLEQADHAIANWLNDQAEAKERKRVAARLSEQAAKRI